MRYSVRTEDVFVTRYVWGFELATWESGERFSRKYIGYSRRDAVREFRREFTESHA